MKLKSKKIVYILIICFVTFFFCEFINYYLIINQCSWPELQYNVEENNFTLKTMLLADTHLLGPYRGHWFDKLRREWQMYRAFQSAITLHNPDVVFILGDLFDEGQWCTDTQFAEYMRRFYSLFEVPNTTKLYVIPGNHDVGFHYELEPDIVERFEKTFNISSVELLTIKGINFVMINSMALHGDGCFYCVTAEHRIKKIAGKLNCRKGQKKCKDKIISPPIVLQHFPMFRESDSLCNQTDEAPLNLKNKAFREKWDCLSKRSSQMIYTELHPRLIFSGHTHHGCSVIHHNDIIEHTLPSFSWRNKNNPTFMLAKFTPNKYSLQKCEMPKESTVIFMYSFFLIIIISVLVHQKLAEHKKFKFFITKVKIK